MGMITRQFLTGDATRYRRAELVKVRIYHPKGYPSFGSLYLRAEKPRNEHGDRGDYQNIHLTKEEITALLPVMLNVVDPQVRRQIADSILTGEYDQPEDPFTRLVEAFKSIPEIE